MLIFAAATASPKQLREIRYLCLQTKIKTPDLTFRDSFVEGGRKATAEFDWRDSHRGHSASHS
jgi:hypothetical protein